MSFQIEQSAFYQTKFSDIEHFYQPIYNAHSGCLDRAEVLLRVRDGHGGYLDTEAFVHAAEAGGQIGEIDRQSFIHACSVLPEFQTYGVRELEVNFSPTGCQQPKLIEELLQILTAHKVATNGICLEITEAAAHSGEDGLFRLLRQLRELGINLALDDFGKGYSNIPRLAGGPFQVLKLDKALISTLKSNEKKLHIVLQHIVHLAAELGMRVVAEGVETKKQARLLIDIGCDFLQGYYFSPPPIKKRVVCPVDTLDGRRSRQLVRSVIFLPEGGKQ